MKSQFARFNTGDACLYEGKRYTIVSPVWIDPFPGVFTWHIERLLDRNEEAQEFTASLRFEEMKAGNGITTFRPDGRYHEIAVAEDELTRLDDPPTWAMIDELRARIIVLEEALQLKYRQPEKK